MLGLFADVLALLLKYNTLVPDVLGHGSMMTKDNPHTPVPPDASTLEGREVAKHVIHIPVRFMDVAPGKEVGKIAFSARVDVNEGQRLRPGKLFG